MPNLQRLLASGVRGNLKSIEPKLSPILWTSIATGKVAEKHGILNFVEPRPDGEGIRVSQSTSRKTKAVWNILSQQQRVTNVIGWYASHPAEPINGRIVSNLLHEGFEVAGQAQTPLMKAAVHPVELTDEIAASRSHFQQFPVELLNKMLPRLREIGERDHRVEALKKRMSYAISIENAAKVVLSAGEWDSTFVFFDAIDTMGHLFMQYRAPKMKHVSQRELTWFGGVMDEVYKWHDESLGRLLAAAGDDVNVIIVSDHGFHSDALRPNMDKLPPERRMELESSWHREFGVIIASGNAFAAGVQPAPCSILDIAPTCLAVLGIAPGNDMDGRVMKEILSDPSLPELVDSWDSVDGMHGLHPAELRTDPIETSASIKQLMDLGYLAALPASIREQIDLVERESTFNLAVSLMTFKKYVEAIPLLQQLYHQRTDVERYGLCLAESHMSTQDFPAALSVLEAIRQADPSNMAALLMASNCLTEMGQLEDAIELTAHAEKTCRDQHEYAMSLTDLAYRQSRFDVAEQWAGLALSVHRQDPMVHVLLAKIALAKGEFEPCAEHALDALEITDAVPDAHRLLGISLAWLGDLDNAMTSLKTALHYDNDSAEAHLTYQVLLLLSGNKKEADLHRNEWEARLRYDLAKYADKPFGSTHFARHHNLKL
jgi:predicted AlkP superfamily phosphohydrolase/phosphomutase/tetratricopeptide (TPR) repeat protein